MYKKILLLLLAMLLFAAPLGAASLKVGVVDMKEIIEKSEPGQKALEELSGEFEGMKEKLEEKKAELQDMREELQKQSLVLSQEAKQDKEFEFKRKVRDFQDLYKNYQRKMKMQEQKLSEPIIEKLAEVIKDYGKEHNYTMIIDKRNSGLVFADDAVDITNKIMVKLNKIWRKEKAKEKQ